MKNTLFVMSAAIALIGGSAMADSPIQIGQLTCDATDVKNRVLVTKQEFDCTFLHSDGSKHDYVGAIRKVGVDLSIKEGFTIVWNVIAATGEPNGEYNISGTYVGGSADIALGVGVGAKVLYGKGEDAFSLKPISVTGVQGGGASLGIESFQLLAGS